MPASEEAKFVVNERVSDIYLCNYVDKIQQGIKQIEQVVPDRFSSSTAMSSSSTSMEDDDEEEYVFVSVGDEQRIQQQVLQRIANDLEVIECPDILRAPILDVFSKLQLYAQAGDKRNQAEARNIYTELMLALDRPEIHVCPNRAPFLAYVYESLFANDLNLINEMQESLGFVGDEAESLDVRARTKQRLGLDTLGGIYDEDGNSKGVLPVSHPESLFDRVINGVLGVNSNPQAYHNKPYTLGKVDQIPGAPTRLRIGAQIVAYRPTLMEQVIRVPQTFFNFLRSIAGKDPKECCYLYVNLMKRREGDGATYRPRSERDYEGDRTEILHDLENRGLGVVVVTLPADNSFFLKGFDKHHKGKLLLSANKSENFVSVDDLFASVVDSIAHNKNDCYMSDATKKKVFGGVDADSISATIKPLFADTCYKLFGTRNLDKISYGQRQAVLFHFFKHELTNNLLSTLKPKYFNISCKDAIDRGGVHNLWDILCNRIESGQEMSLQEFEGLLCMPAILVKDRPINDHMYLVVNALRFYYTNLEESKKKLIPWADKWLSVHSLYGEKYKEAYMCEPKTDACDDFFELNSASPHLPLFDAVLTNDSRCVSQLEDSNAKLSIWEGASKKETVLLSAAWEGNYDMFMRLLTLHANNPKKLPGLRSSMPAGVHGTPLNYLLKYFFVQQDVENRPVMANAVGQYVES